MLASVEGGSLAMVSNNPVRRPRLTASASMAWLSTRRIACEKLELGTGPAYFLARPSK